SITGPPADVGAPPTGIARSPGVRAAAGSVVRVLGSACGLAIEGSGWAAGPDLIVTNAHVVAGEEDTRVETGSTGVSVQARAVLFDAHDDVAVLEARGLGAPALRLASDPASGTAGAILGYPENGGYDVEPGRIGRTQAVQTEDAYGRGPVTRLLTPLRG